MNREKPTTIADVLVAYQAGTTVRSVVESSIAAMEGDQLNAIRSMHDQAALLAEADAADEHWELIRANGKISPNPSLLKRGASPFEQGGSRGLLEPRLLEGVPIVLKDNMAVRGELTGAASRILEGYRSPYSATVVDKLRAAGAIIMGKANMDEFAMGSSGENSGYGPTKNPVDTTKVPGGSSSGSTAAVAAGYVPVALGSDTGGSIRLPASFCGVVGLKPTYGRVSRYGLLALASSLDQIGPLTHSVADAGRVLEVIAGRDPMDQTSQAIDDLTGLTESLSSRRPGGGEIPNGERDFSLIARNDKPLTVASFDGPKNLQGLDQRVRELVRAERDSFTAEVGATMTSFDAIVGESAAQEFLDLALDTYYIILPAEVSSNLARYDGIRFGIHPEAKNLQDVYLNARTQGFGAETKRRIMLGTHVLSSGYYDAYYKTALKARAYVEQQFAKVFESVDVLMGPTAASTAFSLGERAADPLAMYLADLYTIPANIGGLCAVSVPCGEVDGLPVGMQFIAKGGDERKLLTIARAFEQWREQQ